jgi:Family of unknown function (DUF5990)
VSDDRCVEIRIEGFDPPTWEYDDNAGGAVGAGLQRGKEVEQVITDPAGRLIWHAEATAIERSQGDVDLGGPFVHGRRGDRFLYLAWGTVQDGGEFAMFRRAKLMFDGVPPDILATAAETGAVLVGRLGLREPDGTPRCAAVRPPDIVWTVASSD